MPQPWFTRLFNARSFGDNPKSFAPGHDNDIRFRCNWPVQHRRARPSRRCRRPLREPGRRSASAGASPLPPVATRHWRGGRAPPADRWPRGARPPLGRSRSPLACHRAAEPPTCRAGHAHRHAALALLRQNELARKTATFTRMGASCPHLDTTTWHLSRPMQCSIRASNRP